VLQLTLCAAGLEDWDIVLPVLSMRGIFDDQFVLGECFTCQCKLYDSQSERITNQYLKPKSRERFPLPRNAPRFLSFLTRQGTWRW
jgi:hypothetical protein